MPPNTPIDRIQSVRPIAVEAAALATGRVVPVVPVNPPVQAVAQTVAPAEPTPGVVNMIKTVSQPDAGGGVYSSVADPMRPGSEAAAAPKDWTIKRPEPEKVQDPPPEPLSKILIDHIKSLWEASASAVQVQQQVRNQLEPVQNPGATVAQGKVSSEVYDFSPTKIQKLQKPEN